MQLVFEERSGVEDEEPEVRTWVWGTGWDSGRRALGTRFLNLAFVAATAAQLGVCVLESPGPAPEHAETWSSMQKQK